MENVYIWFNILLWIPDPCSHCYLNPPAKDGPCKVNSNGLCVNQADTSACSLSPGAFTAFCKPQVTGDFELTTWAKFFTNQFNF